MRSAQEASSELGVSVGCDALDLSRATFYRRRLGVDAVSEPRQLTSKTQPRALSEQERAVVLETLNSERFVDDAPSQVYASLIDKGVYLCSIRTMYRILAENDQVRERRDQLRHPAYTAPQLLATERSS